MLGGLLSLACLLLLCVNIDDRKELAFTHTRSNGMIDCDRKGDTRSYDNPGAQPRGG